MGKGQCKAQRKLLAARSKSWEVGEEERTL